MTASGPDQGAGGARRGPEGLAAALGEVARSLEDEGYLESTLDAIVHAAVRTVPGADHASITMVRGRAAVQSRASTSDTALRQDQAQYRTGEGPCLDALYHRRTAHVPDLAAEPRWPRYAAEVAELGVRSLLSVQLFVTGDDLGALTLMAERPRAFDEESEQVALLFAAHAAVAIVGAEKEDQLRDLLSSRDVVGQAMGILMERYDLGSARAFSVLVRLSRHSNRELIGLALEVVRSKDIPAR